MFQDLDSTLQAILDDLAAPTELRNASVSFETPDKNFTPAQPTVNLFLYEVKENRKKRDPVPIWEKSGNIYVRRLPPMRVDCHYLVTTWSNQIGGLKVAEEHLLLGQTLYWLGRIHTIPPSYLQGSLVNQPLPAPTMVAQVDGAPNLTDWWSSLGASPRPTITLTVTLSLDLEQAFDEGPPVVTKEIRLEQIDVPGSQEIWFTIGGTVIDTNTSLPLANATVQLVEIEREAMTDAAGQFILADIPDGNYTLRTTVGLTTVDQAIVVPGTVLNAYDVSLVP